MPVLPVPSCRPCLHPQLPAPAASPPTSMSRSAKITTRSSGRPPLRALRTLTMRLKQLGPQEWLRMWPMLPARVASTFRWSAGRWAGRRPGGRVAGATAIDILLSVSQYSTSEL